jgi:acetyl-CoA carboxylase biotin carboxylase subunit
MHKILIANRGEIALRIMRTCKEMGIKTLAVFSEADRKAPFVRYADEAVCIGPAESALSYLNMEKIIEVAKKQKADAIHPGYGFLSENADFVSKVVKNGLIFIGPSASAMKMMGDKLSAKEAAKKLDVPLVPGSDGPMEDIEKAKKVAAKIGYPILLKASAGGGGKGMRVVESEEMLEEQLKRASSEAMSAFGNGAIFMEKYVSKPRHIEIQVLADEHGNAVYLFERECSIQRRHQKVVEEAPSSILTPEIRKKMGECAVKLTLGCGYSGAGTIEFLLDENLNFYFLEMNTRLQVEHPVTEFITGIDLVKEQINVAEGKKLSITQKDITMRGHAIELRVCAEDVRNNFMPGTGKLTHYRIPSGPGIRVDDGFEEGMDIPIYYDSMLAKLIAYGDTREAAICRMLRAIDEYKIKGVETTLDFGRFVMQHPALTSGNFDTGFVGKYFTPDKLDESNGNEESEMIAALAGVAFVEEKDTQKQLTAYHLSLTTNKSKWRGRRELY